MIERKEAYSEEFDMTNFQTLSKPNVMERLSEYLYVWNKIN